MSPALRDQDILEHIVRAAEKLMRFRATRSEADFMGDEVVQDAAIRNLEVIGEAVTKLTTEFKTAHADIPWGDIVGMRNRLIHGYMTVNLEIVWDTITTVVPPFLDRIRAAAREPHAPNR